MSHIAFVVLAISATTGAKILGIATAVYAVLQVIKKIFPSVTGVWAFALNIALSVLGYLVTVPVTTLFSLDTLIGLLTVIAAAAGIHGTIKSATTPATPPPPGV